LQYYKNHAIGIAIFFEIGIGTGNNGYFYREYWYLYCQYFSKAML